ncbi:uncharacterized protein LOC128732293 [Anopheles nili]|uniref:uncharacterized protein LOC128732293 n=1 Tax=Anopheles nili TaxID=185578 RepID=UPI00237B093F|nr:uncharacterized protein LOC128732293 [Anopheles nili]
MNAFHSLVTVVLCCVALVTGESGLKFSFEDGMPDVRCPQNDNPMNPIHLPVANDCGKFQKCFNGRAFTISCPPGQEFGMQLQRCDYPVFAQCRKGYVQPQPAGFVYEIGQTDARCPRFDDPFHPAHLAHPTDCKRFFKCFDGRAYELECPDGQEWGKELNRCDYAFLARCSTGGRQDQPGAEEEKQKETEIENAQDTESNESGSAGEGSHSSESKESKEYVKPAKAEFTYNAGVNDVRCPKFDDPFRPIHLAHPTDCRKFLKCFDGRAYTIECPPGQEFGMRINRCDYPQFAQCSMTNGRKSLRKAATKDDYYYDDYYEEEDIPLDSTEWTPEQREMIAGTQDSRCPDIDDPATPVHFIHSKDCGKFYKCYDGRAYLIQCPTGQHWSVRYDRCDYPKVAKCTIRGS